VSSMQSPKLSQLPQQLPRPSQPPQQMPQPSQPPQHKGMDVHASLAALLCGLAKLGVKGGEAGERPSSNSDKNRSSSSSSSSSNGDKNSSSKESNGSDYIKNSSSSSSSREDGSKHSSGSSSSNSTASKESSGRSCSATSNVVSSSMGGCRGSMWGSYENEDLDGAVCMLQPATFAKLSACVEESLLRLAANRLAVVVWSMAQLQVCVCESVCM